MESITINTYRKVAVTLWAAVSVVVGLTIGAMFDLSGKKMMFSVVAAVGVYVLFIVRMYRETSIQVEKDVDEYVEQKYESAEKKDLDSMSYGKPLNNKINEIGVKEMQKHDKEMTNNETREWLDKFLVIQQREEGNKLEEDK
jgi:hypothetical protein